MCDPRGQPDRELAASWSDSHAHHTIGAACAGEDPDSAPGSSRAGHRNARFAAESYVHETDTESAERGRDDARRPALPFERIGRLPPGRPAGARPAGVRDSSARGLRARQAARHGLRDDHRPRHDRRCARDRRAGGHVHLGRADGELSRRAPRGAHPLLWHHAWRPRVAAGPLRRRRDMRGVPRRVWHRQRPRASVLLGRRAAEQPPSAPAGRALSDLGDAQRLARPRAEHACRDLRRDPGRHRDRRQRRPRRHRYRADLHARAGRSEPGRVPRPPACGTCRARR